MKKLTKTLFVVLMTITLLFCTACEFSFNIDLGGLFNGNGCAGFGNQIESPTPAPLPDDEPDVGLAEESLTIEMIPYKVYYYVPYLTTTFTCSDIPDSINLQINGKQVDVELDTIATTEDGKYKFTAEQQLSAIGRIKATSYDVKLIGVFGEETATLYDGAVTFDDDYFVANVWGENNETIYLYDKESNWIGPF